MVTLGEGMLNVRLFDPSWVVNAGVAVSLPLGSGHDDHGRFVRNPATPPPPGFYAIVAEEPHRVTAAVDRIRSIPIFYGISRDGGLRLSDRAEWVRNEIGANTVLIGARNDFLLAGYVTGENTLVEGVKQLQAGQHLSARTVDGQVEVAVSDYFVFRRTYDNTADDEGLESELEVALDSVMRRTVELAGDRQIAIPLSGGNDSRIIATYLALMCPNQVVAFAYGRPSLGEVAISQSVAESLGLKWHFVEGSEAFWSDLRRSEAVQGFLETSHQLVSAPYMQDWPAVRHLVASGVLEDDAVIVPGHSGDVPTGGMMLPELVSKESHSSVESAVRSYHYSLWPSAMLDTNPESLEEWIKRVSLPRAWGYGDTQLDSIGQGDTWNWRERQAKWLVNSLRGIEAAGPTWWMPLWDAEFTQFWTGAPFRALQGRSLYRRFVHRKFREVAGCDIPNYEHRTSLTSRSLPVVKQFVPTKLKPLARGLYRRISPPSPGFGEMGWERWVYPHWQATLGSSATNITSFAALETLAQAEQNIPGLVPEAFVARLGTLPK